MDAAPSPYRNDLSRQLAIIRAGLRPSGDLAIPDGSFIEFDVTRDVTHGQRLPTAIEKARARWRSAQIVE